MPTTVDPRYAELASQRWRSYRTGDSILFSWTPNPTPTPVTDAVLYDETTVIDAWDTVKSPPNTATSAYTTLSNRVNARFGGNTRTIPSQGTSLTTLVGQGNTFVDDARYAKCQAVLWAADGNATRRNKVIEVLEAFKNIRTIYARSKLTTPNGGQSRLELSWCIPSLCEAAHIIGYDDPIWDGFLNFIYPELLWRTSVNWQATMANSRMSIANALNDNTKRADATAFFNFYLARGVYHSAYDGGSINPMPNVWWDDPTVLSAPGHQTTTNDHWWNSVVVPAPWTAQDPRSGYTFVSGIDGEFRRDWNHQAMSAVGFFNCARNIVLAGGTVSAESHARLLAFATVFSARALYYLDNGTLSGSGYPSWDNGGSGTPDQSSAAIRMCWYIIKTYLGGSTPANVNTIINSRSLAYSQDSAGFNAVAAELMAEGSLLT